VRHHACHWTFMKRTQMDVHQTCSLFLHIDKETIFYLRETQRESRKMHSRKDFIWSPSPAHIMTGVRPGTKHLQTQSALNQNPQTPKYTRGFDLFFVFIPRLKKKKKLPEEPNERPCRRLSTTIHQNHWRCDRWDTPQKKKNIALWVLPRVIHHAGIKACAHLLKISILLKRSDGMKT